MAMKPRRRLTEKRIFFPWEGRGGVLRRLRLGRVRPLVLVLLVGAFFFAIALRERRAAGTRLTRARLLSVRHALDGYLADHEAQCPRALNDVTPYAKFEQVPTDAWGRPLRLVCPGRREDSAYELMSDGPDGLPGGLDRIE